MLIFGIIYFSYLVDYAIKNDTNPIFVIIGLSVMTFQIMLCVFWVITDKNTVKG
jgi:hypothetical protein